MIQSALNTLVPSAEAQIHLESHTSLFGVFPPEALMHLRETYILYGKQTLRKHKVRLLIRNGRMIWQSVITEGNKQKGQNHFWLKNLYLEYGPAGNHGS
jgi:hypothetical protein